MGSAGNLGSFIKQIFQLSYGLIRMSTLDKNAGIKKACLWPNIFAIEDRCDSLESRCEISLGKGFTSLGQNASVCKGFSLCELESILIPH